LRQIGVQCPVYFFPRLLILNKTKKSYFYILPEKRKFHCIINHAGVDGVASGGDFDHGAPTERYYDDQDPLKLGSEPKIKDGRPSINPLMRHLIQTNSGPNGGLSFL